MAKTRKMRGYINQEFENTLHQTKGIWIDCQNPQIYYGLKGKNREHSSKIELVYMGKMSGVRFYNCGHR